MGFSEKLKNLREKKEITLRKVSQDLGIQHTTLMYYEHGERTPKVDVAKQLAEYYGVSLDWLVS